MATLNFNGLTFSYEPVPLRLKQLMQPSGDRHGNSQDSVSTDPIVIPLCTAQLAEQAASQGNDFAADDLMA